MNYELPVTNYELGGDERSPRGWHDFLSQALVSLNSQFTFHNS